MKNRAMVLLVAGMFCGPAQAGKQDCRDAIENFRTVRSDVLDAARRYASCVASSRGRDDCSSEFETLRSEHDDFEEAVSDIEMECN
jgi:hypothetical protein